MKNIKIDSSILFRCYDSIKSRKTDDKGSFTNVMIPFVLQ